VVSLLEHQIVLGRCLQAPGADMSAASIADQLHDLAINRDELFRLVGTVLSPGFRFTRHVQRSWCVGRTAGAAQLTLSAVPVEQRRRLIEDWFDTGGGRALDPASEAPALLEFVARHLADPSHALSVCRMEQAAYCASAAALRFAPPALSLLDDPGIVLRTGEGAAMVRFFAEPQRLFGAIKSREPLPPLSDRPLPVLFAPGLPKLYRAATQEEEAIWQALVGPRAVRELSRDGQSGNVIEELFRAGAVELAAVDHK
jgi:hypothetical protein